MCISAVLHSYKLTRFSNAEFMRFYEDVFYTLTNLQGSQTSIALLNTNGMFYTLTNLQGSQTARKVQKRKYSFTLLQTYKVLKQCMT